LQLRRGEIKLLKLKTKTTEHFFLTVKKKTKSTETSTYKNGDPKTFY
jgi:hypothetical protein